MAAGAGRMFPDVQLTVTDVDQAIVDAARGGLVELRNVTVPTADVTAMPFNVGKFDAVTWHLMLHHVIHWDAALAEIARVLKPGGLSMGYNLTDTTLARLIRQVDGSTLHTIAPDELAEELTAAGFT